MTINIGSLSGLPTINTAFPSDNSSKIPNILIATPCKDGTVDINYAIGLASSGKILSDAGVKWATSHVSTSSIDNARNILANTFLKTPCTHLLFIDDDMAWAADLPLRMLKENVEIVGVPCRKKMNEVHYAVRHPQRVASLEKSPWMVVVEGVGMAMTLIKREVFEKLSSKVPIYHCFSGKDDKGECLFFRHDLIEQDGELRYESEDLHFCRLARKEGFEIFAYVDEDVPHIGRRAFRGAYSDWLGRGIPHGFTSKRERMTVQLTAVEQ
jgi:hypothetical protein